VACAHSSGPGGAVKAGDLYLYPFGNDAAHDDLLRHLCHAALLKRTPWPCPTRRQQLSKDGAKQDVGTEPLGVSAGDPGTGRPEAAVNGGDLLRWSFRNRALGQFGRCDRTVVDDLGALGAAVAGLAPGSLDCYVQLPVQLAPRGNAVIDLVRNFLEDGLLAWFTAASTIFPAPVG
jgi:hypothetical protein